MDKEPLISNRFLLHLDQIIIERGGRPYAFLERAGLPYATLVGGDVMVPFKSHVQLLEIVESELNLHPLGLNLAFRQFVSHFEPLYDVLVSQNSIEGSLHAFGNNLNKVIEGLSTSVKVDGGDAYFLVGTEWAFLNSSSIFQDHVVTCMTQLMRWLLGTNFKLKTVYIPHSEPQNVHLYYAFFGCPVQFDSPRMGVSFSKQHLAQAVVPASAGGSMVDINEVIQWYKKANLMYRSRNLIQELIADKQCSLDSLAIEVEMSARTLQRRFSQEKTSFNHLLDSVRSGLAREHLANTRYSIKEVSELLGYADHACFIRSFKRWFDTTPSKWRQLTFELSSIQ